MHARLRFDDLIVVLPGIGGSTLHRGDTPVWKPPLALGGALRPFGHALEQLAGDHRLLDDPAYDDGIVASGLIGASVTIPGLAKLNQYRRLRRRLLGHFDLVPGDSAVDGPPANYFEFPYDWRRDNRVSAERLKDLVDRELPKWATTLPYGKPRTVLLGHSMGGLVAKYYLDALGGWEHCRTLITFGTPFRGSLAALEVLTGGVRALGITLDTVSSVIGEFTSVHQLLPRYPVLVDRRPGARPEARPRHVHASPVPLGALDLGRAKDAYEDFHRRMDGKGSGPVSVVPVVGYGHPTWQTAVLDREGLLITEEPAALDASQRWLGTGDRTVPAVSAIPVELSGTGTWAWENATHSTIHATDAVLDRLVRTLALPGSGLQDLQGPDADADVPGTAFAAGPDPLALALHVDDVYAADQPVVLTCRSPETAAGAEPPALSLTLSPPGGDGVRTVLDAHDGAARWTVTGLTPGAYEVTVTVGSRSVSDVVEVW
ncbi:esterase/lipase family protein [Streptomyces goshikiensis]|uniref:esterase/lipase family protein n=1 Tax=Streptomyces goshikiensis TaxID=1942 RepID=UPI00365D467E